MSNWICLQIRFVSHSVMFHLLCYRLIQSATHWRQTLKFGTTSCLVFYVWYYTEGINVIKRYWSQINFPLRSELSCMHVLSPDKLSWENVTLVFFFFLSKLIPQQHWPMREQLWLVRACLTFHSLHIWWVIHGHVSWLHVHSPQFVLRSDQPFYSYFSSLIENVVQLIQSVLQNNSMVALIRRSVVNLQFVMTPPHPYPEPTRSFNLSWGESCTWLQTTDDKALTSQGDESHSTSLVNPSPQHTHTRTHIHAPDLWAHSCGSAQSPLYVLWQQMMYSMH